MTTPLLVRRFLADYSRNGANLLMLVLVPAVFVGIAAPAVAQASSLFGGVAGGPAVESGIASGAAGFLAGLAMYFQVSASRDADRRLVIAGLPSSRLVSARALTGLVLAVLASTVAMAALALRTGTDDPVRVFAGTLMSAVIYLAIGAMVGAVVHNPVNGSVLILFIWMIDWILGPVMSGGKLSITRILPTHFTSLWMVDLPSGHGGRVGDLGWALVWVVAAGISAYAVVAANTRVGQRRRARATPGSSRDQLAGALRSGWRDGRRNPILWILLGVVPAVYILLANAITPSGMTPVVVEEGGRRFTEMLDPAHFHPGVMVPIAVASLSTLAGLFLVLDTATADRRLRLAGMRAGVVLTARLAIVGMAAVLTTSVSLAITATVFDAHQWGVYGAATLLVALTYGLIGVLLGPVFGRVSGVFIAFLLPFLDLGIGQSPMLRGEPAAWAQFLPGYGGMRVLIDGGLTTSFDQTRALLIGLAWLGALATAILLLIRQPRRVTIMSASESDTRAHALQSGSANLHR